MECGGVKRRRRKRKINLSYACRGIQRFLSQFIAINNIGNVSKLTRVPPVSCVSLGKTRGCPHRVAGRAEQMKIRGRLWTL